MSEVNDALQVVMVTGRSAYVLGKISIKAAIGIMKLLNTIYLAKWKGKSSLRRFRQIKGDDYTFINVGTEDKSKLRAIEKEMKKHGILFAKMPDLCGGDGRTQYVISPADAAKFKSFLLDHANGKYRGIKVGPISPEDYMKSGIGKDGKETQELQSLIKSAEEEHLKEKQKVPDTEKVVVKTPNGTITVDKDKLSKISDYVPNFKLHDAKVKEESASLIDQEPLKANDRWAMYQMPDGVHAVIIPKEDLINRTFHAEEGIQTDRAIIYHNKVYKIVNLKDQEISNMSGKQIGKALQEPGFREKNIQAKNLKLNKGMISKEFARNAARQVRG